MSRKRRGRRLLAAFTVIAITSSLIVPHRTGRAAIEAVMEGQVVTDYVVLHWTAPGDDGLSGRATRYDLRYSLSSISGTDTLGWWSRATQVNLWNKIPAQPGMPDSLRLLGLVSGNRYFAMLRTCDEVPNWSPYSNVAIIQSTDLVAPKAVTDLRVR